MLYVSVVPAPAAVIVYVPVAGTVHFMIPWVVISRYVLYHALGVGVPVSPERACEITGPF